MAIEISGTTVIDGSRNLVNIGTFKGLTYPSSDGSSGQALTTNGGGTLSFTSVQPLDAGLTSIASLSTTSDRMIYTTGSDSYAVTTLSAFARTILDDANGDAVCATIGAAKTSGTDFTGSVGIRDIDETRVSLSGTTPTLTTSQGQLFILTTSGNTTVSVVPPGGRAWVRTLHVSMGGTHTLAISGADWGDAGAPTDLSSGDQIKIQLDGYGSTFSASISWRKTA